jgi:hypothetical protein
LRGVSHPKNEGKVKICTNDCNGVKGRMTAIV